jgi:hypothetical protein
VLKLHIVIFIKNKYGYELPSYIKGGEFLDYLSDYELLSKDSAPWNSF